MKKVTLLASMICLLALGSSASLPSREGKSLNDFSRPTLRSNYSSNTFQSQGSCDLALKNASGYGNGLHATISVSAINRVWWQSDSFFYQIHTSYNLNDQQEDLTTEEAVTATTSFHFYFADGATAGNGEFYETVGIQKDEGTRKVLDANGAEVDEVYCNTVPYNNSPNWGGGYFNSNPAGGFFNPWDANKVVLYSFVSFPGDFSASFSITVLF